MSKCHFLKIALLYTALTQSKWYQTSIKINFLQHQWHILYANHLQGSLNLFGNIYGQKWSRNNNNGPASILGPKDWDHCWTQLHSSCSSLQCVTMPQCCIYTPPDCWITPPPLYHRHTPGPAFYDGRGRRHCSTSHAIIIHRVIHGLCMSPVPGLLACHVLVNWSKKNLANAAPSVR